MPFFYCSKILFSVPPPIFPFQHVHCIVQWSQAPGSLNTWRNLSGNYNCTIKTTGVSRLTHLIVTCCNLPLSIQLFLSDFRHQDDSTVHPFFHRLPWKRVLKYLCPNSVLFLSYLVESWTFLPIQIISNYHPSIKIFGTFLCLCSRIQIESTNDMTERGGSRSWWQAG